MQPLISVIICTHNRAACLSKVLGSLYRQTLDQSLYEVLVVDNNSSDDTPAACRCFAGHPNFRCIPEPRTGLSCARNCGWRQARGVYAAYLDDDALAPRPWLMAAKSVIERQAPDAFGGPYYPFYNSPRPHWFKDTYACHDLGPRARALTGAGLTGGNLFVKRKLLQQMGGFNEQLGMRGRALGFGEETALLLRMHKTLPGLSVYYDPDVYVYHLVKPERMSLRHSVSYCFAAGRYALDTQATRAMLDQSRRTAVLREAMTVIRRLGLDIIKAVCWRDTSTYRYRQNYVFERCLPHVRRLGWLYEQGRQAGRF